MISDYLCHSLVRLFALKPIKLLNEQKLSKQLNICSQCQHEVTPQAQLLYLFCSGHNYGIFLQADVCQSMSGRPRRWVSTTAGSDCVWSSHLYVSNQLSPPGGSMLNKPPVELVFVLKGSANRDPECSHFQNRGPLQLSSISPPAHNQHQLNLWHFDTHRRTL